MRRNVIVAFTGLLAAISTPAMAALVGPGRPENRRVNADQAAPSTRGLAGRAKTDLRRASANSADAETAAKLTGRTTVSSVSTIGGVAGSLCVQPAENCQDGDNDDAYTSDRVYYVVADDFTPTANGTISELCWTGGYFDFDGGQECPDVTTNTFRVRYYENAGGLPGTNIAEFKQTALPPTLSVSGPQWTGRQIAGQIKEYEYVATHEPVPVEAGRCYWVEISNALTGCSWLWELSVQGNDWAVQKEAAADGYELADTAPVDLAFCFDLPLGDSTVCLPPAPPNDDCANAETIAGEGTFAFDNTTARTDGPPHDACLAVGERQIDADVWYCWTSPCTEKILVSTCGLTSLDTRIAVYDGCGTCPPTDGELLTCNDDRCGEILDPFQSMAVFDAIEGHSYLIRVGVYPNARRGADLFSITCGPPENPFCPGSGSCCEDTGTEACDDVSCCELVCACDPFCCDTLWDIDCATNGFMGSTCGAQALCAELCNVCGNSPVDCCVGTPEGTEIPGCSDQTCCEKVCAEDSYCCEKDWDDACATDGFEHNGNGAQILCPDLCGGAACPAGEINWISPPDGVVDARQPHPPNDAGELQGIDTIVLTGPVNPYATLDCWSLVETGDGGLGANRITVLNTDSFGRYTLTLARPITPGEATTITYQDDGGGQTNGVFISHPGNVNADSQSSPSDILRLIDYINGVATSPWSIYSEDVDHSGLLGPPDILRTIDLLNGAGLFAPWLNTPLPTPDASP